MTDFDLRHRDAVYLQYNTGAIYKRTKSVLSLFLSELSANGPWLLTVCEDQGAAQAMWELAHD